MFAAMLETAGFEPLGPEIPHWFEYAGLSPDGSRVVGGVDGALVAVDVEVQLR